MTSDEMYFLHQLARAIVLSNMEGLTGPALDTLKDAAAMIDQKSEEEEAEEEKGDDNLPF